ncbi:MAG: TIGR01777 family protein [Ignavibacteriaceae bacterium]|nr:TIGR01777 family protein [Ignavibacteriaceae bacterium]
MKKLLITGATGSIGKILVQKLSARGDEVIIFTRNPESAKKKIVNASKYVKWDFDCMDAWLHEMHGVDVVVHLAGANLGGKRWNDEYKKLAYDSRIISTRSLVEAIKQVERKPKAFICSSAVGIYGSRYDEVLDENSSHRNDFLANLCNDWEKEAQKVEALGVRRVSIRTGLVLMKDEGLIKQLLLPFKLFIGGPLAGGRQWFPWIHIDDIVGIYLQAIDNLNVNGAVNAASPGIVQMKEFTKTFGNVLNRPSLLPVPKFALKLAAGELGEYAVMSQRTSVEKIIKSGYKFKFEKLNEALVDLLR